MIELAAPDGRVTRANAYEGMEVWFTGPGRGHGSKGKVIIVAPPGVNRPVYVGFYTSYGYMRFSREANFNQLTEVIE